MMGTDSFMQALTAQIDCLMPIFGIGAGIVLVHAVCHALGGWLAKSLAEAYVTDERKKKKNDYLDYYDNLLSEQDQGDPAIAYYDEVISEEMRK